MDTDPALGAAWNALHAARERLPDWEAARHPSWHPEERAWVASAYYAGHLGRFERRPVVEGRGATETEALRDLASRMRSRGPAEPSYADLGRDLSGGASASRSAGKSH